MQYNEGSQLDTSQVSTGGGGGGGRVAVGGGIGTMIILFILSQIFGVDLTGLAGGGQTQTQNQGSETSMSQCRTGADIAKNRECRFVAYTNSIQAYWSKTLQGYQMTQTKLFTGQIQTACGAATAAVGPFYCPGDQFVYLDTSFFDQLTGQLGAKGGDAAEAYVIAHEYGHHISNQTGVMAKAQSNETGPTSPSVRLELQADCYGGVWLKHATDDPNGPIQGITQDDLDRAVDAAKSVGDDRIQQASQGRVNPEKWTHGSAQMRKYWLAQGYNSGDPRQCDTFAADAKVG